jgi:hypothetical protein
MATPTASPAPLPNPDLTLATTRRGLATATFCFGFWSLLVFWWYPYALFLAMFGTGIGIVSVMKNWRGGLHGENLALVGLVFCQMTIGHSLIAYRGVAAFFENIIPTYNMPIPLP